MESLADILLSRLRRKPILIAPGAYNALCAKLIENAGFEAIYVGGASISYSEFALPDLGFIGLEDMQRCVLKIRNTTSLPIICDADTGYGNDVNVKHTVKVLEMAGANAIQIEDQVFPKKCGHLEDKRVITEEEMILKIKAALQTRKEALIIARTDAYSVLGLKEAIKRANLYLKNGADIAFVEAPQNIKDIKTIAQNVKGLKMVNMVEGGKSPLLSSKVLEEFGYNLVIFPGSAIRVTVKALQKLFSILKIEGSTTGYLKEMVLFDELQKILSS